MGLLLNAYLKQIFCSALKASDEAEMSRSILGNATNMFKRKSLEGENALSTDTRYEKIRSLGRGSFGGLREMGVGHQKILLHRDICVI